MAFTYTTVNGQRVETTVARQFEQMRAEFKRVFGLDLMVRSGTRTRAEQQRLYDGWVRRLPGYNLAAPPGQSYHEESGPQGPRALDIYDSGNDAGVTVIGSRRNNWIRDNGPRWGFTLSGLTFNPREGWHIHYTGALGAAASPDNGQWPARARYGEAWVKSAQDKLRAFGLYSGDTDGKDGPQTQGAVKALQTIGGLEQDGIYGPQTNELADLIRAGRNETGRAVSEIQRVVGAPIDNAWGPVTSLKTYIWQKANGLVADARFGPASEAKAFPPVVVTPGQPAKQYPTNGRNITSRPTADIQRLVGAKDDGDYGPDTSQKVAIWQEANGLDVDGIWGNASDAKGFPGVPVPSDPTPEAKPRIPVYPGATAGWDVPLGQTKRDEGSIVSTLYVHHETKFSSDVEYFKRKNERGSCPTWEVNGKVVTEMIHPALRPSATGKANTYSVAIETVNSAGEPDWKVSDDSVESIAQIFAWLVKVSRSSDPYITAPDGTRVKVAVTLDRNGLRGHKEADPVGNPTRCPGEFLFGKLDYIVERARAILEVGQPQPQPDTIAVDRGWLTSIFDKLKTLLGK